MTKIESNQKPALRYIYNEYDLNYSTISPEDVFSGEDNAKLPGIAPNVGILSYTSTRQCRLCRVPQIKQCASDKSRAIREWSQQLFNSFPVNIRCQTGCSVTSFNDKLDKYLPTRQTKNTRVHNRNGLKLHHIYEEFPGKLSNTAKPKSSIRPERLYSRTN